MLYATTSNGVYFCDVDRAHATRVLGNKHTAGLFARAARGYFGITHHMGSGNILVASRERGRTARHNKPTTDVKLHFIDPDTHRAWLAAEVNDVHDVHQIALDDDRVFLTDTGKNRIIGYDLITGGRTVLNVGPQRQDINHINAVRVHQGMLLIGLNNRGLQPAAVLKLPLSTVSGLDDASVHDALALGQYCETPGAMHTHDLAADSAGSVFACASHDGFVFDIDTGAIVLKPGGWTRGLAFTADTLWVGASQLASRENRHSESLDGEIAQYAIPGGHLLNRIVLKNAGQVNDLLDLDTVQSEPGPAFEKSSINLS